jgi:ParB-like chromosome segregation protein Spo0J
MTRDRIELDLHRLELRFADSRLVEPRALARLAESIEQCGQIVPCVVVAAPESQDGEAGGAQALVLIDGYRRVGALRRLGRDTVAIEQWSCDLATALPRLLARARDRAFASIEEALLLRALVDEHGLSLHEVARRSGRDVSWVSRRLQLLSGLPDAALAAVRGGRLSSWAANRVIVPLARANPEHAERLLEMLATSPLSTGAVVLVRALSADRARLSRAHGRPPAPVHRHADSQHGVARRGAPACRPRRRMHRRPALPRGGDRAAAQACRHAAPAASAADRGGAAPARGHRSPDQGT